jgi:rfaE bifunctional protein nucleotidyltransferase chain/domain
VSTLTKVLSVEEAARIVREAQSRGEVVAMCHGCFDIVHPGHIRHLQHAAKMGDRLLVTVTGDALMEKGTGRPLIPQELRAENLAALNCVSWVAINPRPTAAELLDIIRPDVYIKGREYEHNSDPRFALEKQIVERHGGRVVFTSGDVVFSSTALINALEEAASPFQATTRQLIEQHGIGPESTDPLIASFQGKRVLVIGETIKDTYVICDRPAVAGESPMMTLRPLEHRSFDGGTAIICKHLAAMGARPTLLTTMPFTTEAEALRVRLHTEGIEVRWVEIDQVMIEKQRFLVGTTKVMKLDLGGPLTLDAAHQAQFIQQAAEAAANCDAVIIADFGQGLFTPAMLTRLCQTLRPIVPVMSGDVSGRRSNLLAMRQMDLLCPSEPEIRDALHNFDEGLSSVVWRVLDITKTRSAIATLGADGLIAFDRTKDADLNRDGWQTRLTAQHVPALSPYAVDQLGCGDALLAAATLTLCSGGSLTMAAVLGSIAAASQSQRLGNAVIGAADLRRGIRRLCNAQLAWHAEPTSTLVKNAPPAAAAAAVLNRKHDHVPLAHA